MTIAKEIGLLRDLVPRLATIGVLVDPANIATAAALSRDVQRLAEAAGIKAVVAEVSSERDVESAFARLVEQQVDALVISGLVFFNRYRDRIVALTAQHRIPAIFSNRVFPDPGGLMSYGSLTEAGRQMGAYTARILKGEKPIDLPVVQSTKFDFVINLPTARALGLTIPPMLLARAGAVIE